MSEPMSATIGRMCDNVRKGWTECPKDWARWRATYAALSDTYYADSFSQADQAYALEGLLQYEATWQREHGHKCIEQRWLDEAAAHEVRYHATRGRIFRRACAALSTCWRAIAVERPERVIDRSDRAIAYAKKKAAKHN